MEFVRFDGDIRTLDTDLVAVGVRAGEDLFAAGPAAALNEALDGLLATVAEEERFEAKDGQTLSIHTHGRIGPRRILLVGFGKPGASDGRTLAARAVRLARERGLTSLGVVALQGEAGTFRSMVIGARLGHYAFDAWKTRNVKESRLVRVDICAGTGDPDVATPTSIADAICFARDLVNEPPQALTPTTLGIRAEEMAAEQGLRCTIFDREALEERGMRSILAVSAGSGEEPRLILLTYHPPGATDSTPSVALVGKGLTFDAGGLCLKPIGSIEEMKMDMAGGAAVLGAMKAVAAVAPDVVVHGIVPASENLPGSSAYKPGDVVRTYLGKTVEVWNTDAEGRLLLADALAYAAELGPAEIVDVATLTGAICIALGMETAGAFGNDEALLAAVLDCAKAAGEVVWHMPLDERLRKQLKSPIADMKNVGKRWGGAITGALFLSEFIGDRKWVHLDIAGPAFAEKTEDHVHKGGTGFGVATLLEYVKRAGKRLL